MLGDPRTVRVTGDDTAAVFRRAEDAGTGKDPRDGPVQEAYVWCNLTSGDSSRALWLLLLPFMVVNLAHWMRPAAPGRHRTVRLYGLLVRLAALSLTVLLVAAACEVALDLVAWQCAGVRSCAHRHSWPAFLAPLASMAPGGHATWWSLPGRRLAFAALVPTALTVLLWYLSRRTWSAYESHRPMSHDPGPDPGGSALTRPGFWYGRRLVARLRAAHTAAALLTVAAAVAAPAVGFERDRIRHEHPGEPEDPGRTRAIAHARAMATLTDRAPLMITVLAVTTLLLGAVALAGAPATGKTPEGAARRTPEAVQAVAGTSQALGSWLVGLGFVLFVTWGRRAYKDASARRTIGILWDVGTFWPRAAHPFAPPCYAERAVPDLTWRMATWTQRTGGRLVLSGHSQGSVLAAAAAWQLPPSVRGRIALLTYGCPLERLYGRWFPAHFGPPALAALHRDIACWANLYRATDPIGGPVRVPADGTPEVDHGPLRDPLAYGRTPEHPLPAPALGHSDYQADPAFAHQRARLLSRLRPELPDPRPQRRAPR
ncbi:DUF2974 domain-containing protein [Streptomyces puniciscabiei]|uniref:DUF2974 domain-containing protein n=1 Tax=Streptomyces puniciscabiei TaxID=164348 RepID=UPI001F3E62D4|nr:DUF2974 domain-containing protein [Streptomyces puniciscabiei]